MRFESFHQELKRTAYSTKCKINVLETLMIKNNLKISNFILNYDQISNSPTGHGIAKKVSPELKRFYNFRSQGLVEFDSYVYHKNMRIMPEMVLKYSTKFIIIDVILM